MNLDLQLGLWVCRELAFLYTIAPLGLRGEQAREDPATGDAQPTEKRYVGFRGFGHANLQQAPKVVDLMERDSIGVVVVMCAVVSGANDVEHVVTVEFANPHIGNRSAGLIAHVISPDRPLTG